MTDKELKVETEKKSYFWYQFESTSNTLLGPVITAFYQKSRHLFSGIILPRKGGGAIGQQQKAYSLLTSRKVVSMKSFSQPGEISKSPLGIKFVLPPSCFKIQSL